MNVHIRFVNLCTTCTSILCKIDFFISRNHDKTKRSMKKNQYETNSKENPVKYKWKLQLLIMYSHIGLNIENNVSGKKLRQW